MCLFGGNPTYWKHVSLVYSAVEHPAWWQMINFDVKFNFKNYVLGPENLWLCCPANQKCMIWSYDCGARVDMSTLTPGREAGSRGSVKWVRCGVWDEHWGQIDSDLTVVWGPSIAGIHSLDQNDQDSNEHTSRWARRKIILNLIREWYFRIFWHFTFVKFNILVKRYPWF